MPLVVGEAMAMQKPVVATDVGGVREMVADCGILVPARDAEALSAGMMHLMKSGESALKSMGSAGRVRIFIQFNIDALAGTWEARYEELIGRQNVSALVLQ